MTIVPMLRVGMQFVTLCVTSLRRTEYSRSDAERGDDNQRHEIQPLQTQQGFPRAALEYGDCLLHACIKDFIADVQIGQFFQLA
ncbi:hypothetical protein PSE10A_33170 [Pseudomonas amygdali pv. eriobotryae]|uniref:Uncharacterized protein n=1 Tax=Pseudomonas amygdali pv. eriobotryae TaxID=129137 RepID=A0A9P3AFM4_PSEA0|nr:hypothetical protein PSE10A_33170 [Pseudomonas amygdali pv. eriobotryae]